MSRGTMRTISGKTIRLTAKKPGPKPLPPEIKKQRVNICLVPHWHKTGKALAEKQGVSFSYYVECLIYKDSLCNESA